MRDPDTFESQQTLLVVDDEQDILDLVSTNLRRVGFTVVTASDGIEALEVAQKMKPDLIVLDLMLPGKDGFAVIKELRQDSKMRRIPVLMLTAKGEVSDKIAGLEIGADDYLTKPFSPRELTLRIRAILKRSSHVLSESSLEKENFRIERDSMRFYLKGKQIDLTSTEFKLLRLLLEADDRVQEREHLLREVWGYNDSTMTRTLDTHVKRLREKLGDFADCIQTVRGVGYRFSAR